MRIVSYNLLDGGMDPDGATHRRSRQAELLAALDADLVALQECRWWHRDGWAVLWEFANALGMQALSTPSRSGGHHLATLYRAEAIEVTRSNSNEGRHQFHHALARARMRADGFGEFWMLNTHLDPFNPDDRRGEVSWLAAYAGPRHGSAQQGVLAGDLNCIGAQDSEPDWRRVATHLHSWHRQVLPRGGCLGPADRRVTEVLQAAGWIDPPRLLGRTPARTAGHWHQTHPTGHRSDYILITRPLADTPTAHHVIDNDTSRELSDHLPVVLDLTPPAAPAADSVPSRADWPGATANTATVR